MKKLLALVLALVMTLSLCVTSNAAFADAADITHGEAVDVLTTLGVIAGKGNNKFDPAANVTRAEMAKMISIIMLGDVDAAAFVGTSTGLKDVAGHWAEGYIQYCFSQGIIAGKGNNLFDPNANVTAVEAAKMLLGAIGYNATVQGYTGADWAINVTRDAQLSGFYGELKGLATTKALSRDEAAQMIYNAVIADLIEKTPVLNVSTGTLQYEYRAGNKSLMGETFGAVKVEGIVVGNEYACLDDASVAEKAGKTEIVITNGDECRIYTTGNHETFNVSTGAEELGKNVVLYVKPAAASNAASKATVLGNAFLASDNTVATTSGSFSKASKLDTFLKDAGLKTSLANALYFVNGVLQWTDANGNGAYDAGETKHTFAYTNAVKGYETQFIDNDADGYVDYVLQTAYNFGKVATYSDAKETITITTNGTSIRKTDKDDVVGFENVALNDYVLYAEIGGVYYVEKAETVTGKITAYDTTAKTYSLDGKSYDWSGATVPGGDTKAVKPNAALSFVNATFYLDKAGNVVAYNSTASNAYCLVIGYEPAGGGTDLNEHVLVALPDGTTAKYIFDSSDVTNNTVANVTTADVTDTSTGVLCTYILDDGEIYLTEIGLATDVATTGLTYTKGESLIYDGAAVEYTYVNDSTVFFVVTTKTPALYDDVDVYVGGKNVPSFDLGNTTASIVSKDSKGNIEAIVVVCAAGETGLGTAADFMYVVKYLNTYDGYTEAVAVVDGKVETIKIDKGETATGLVKFTINTDGEYDKLAPLTATKDTKKIVRVTEKSIVVDGAEYEVTANTEIALLDGTDSVELTFAELRKDDTVIVYDETTADGKAEAIYVVEQYDPTNAAILHVDGTVVKKSSTANVDYDVANNTNFATLLAKIDASATATLYISANNAAKLTDVNANIGTLTKLVDTDTTNKVATGDARWLYVVSESGTVFAAFAIKGIA